MMTRQSIGRVSTAMLLSLGMGASLFDSGVAAQDDDSRDDTVPARVSRPAAIHAGDCLTLGEEVASLTSLRSPNGDVEGADDAGRIEYGFTPSIPRSIDQLLGEGHAIVVFADDDDDDDDDALVCGQVGGVREGDGSLVIALASDDDSGTSGVAVLSPSPVDPSTTQASLFIIGSALGTGFGTDDDGTNDDGTNDDGTNDDGTDDDGTNDDGGAGGTDDDGTDDGGTDDDGAADDGTDDDGTGGGSGDDTIDDDGAGDDGGAGGGDDTGGGDDGTGDDDGAGDDDDGDDD